MLRKQRINFKSLEEKHKEEDKYEGLCGKNIDLLICLNKIFENMIKDFVDIFRNLSLRHKGVRTFKYQGKMYNNAQNNYKTFQVYMETASLHNLNITNNIFTSEFELYVLGQPDGTSGNTIEDVQTNAFTIAVDILGALDNWDEYRGILSIHDYSILALSDYTDDKSAGCKLSVVLETPSPLNLCSLDENFNEEPYPEDVDTPQIDIPTEEVGELTITPIKLPRNRKC